MELDAESTRFDATDLLNVRFKPVTGDELIAGVPYIIKWDNTGNNIENPVFTGVTVKCLAPTEVTFDGGSFVGDFSAFEINTTNIDEIVYLGANNTLGYADEERMLHACRAHFVLPSVNGARAMTRSIIYFGDETTGISLTPSPSPKGEGSEYWYDLSGRRLSGKPTQKGVYINNGKKVVIK